MRKVIVLSVILSCFAFAKVEAQQHSGGGDEDYSTAIGIKFYPTALSIKHFVNDGDAALEGLAYFWDYGFRATGLYEFHHDIGGVDGLKWYIGPGFHFGTYSSGPYHGGSTIGVDGVLGLDYKIEDAPVDVSVDWQPSLEFGYEGFQNWGGLGIRYAF